MTDADADRYAHARPLVLAGLAATMVYNVTSAAKEVYAGHVLQTVDPFVLITACFGLVILLFQVIDRAGGGQPSVYTPRVMRALVMVNLTTAGAWLGIYLALRWLEPAVAGGLSGGVGPLAVLAWRRFAGIRTTGIRTTLAEAASGAGILAACLLLAWSAAEGQGEVIAATPVETALGLVAATAGGISATLTSVWAKKLSLAGLGPSAIMARRFWLLVGFCGAVAWATGRLAGPMPSVETVAGIGLLGVALPLYALQVGIRYGRIFHVNVIVGLCPLFTLAFQAFSAWNHWSPLTVAGVALLVAAGYLGLMRPRRSGPAFAAGDAP
ncbi:hypothetical protein [Tistrella mobilis]|uniref:EamA domain-containing protein n=1 Tax=Tistrella mobilis (strain KA081020-065) TaxID=1110502 RepID=I3TX45_TISMK|nr:hypothetical protein [Tistrella mobilis]AFK57333.1 hypothetical protein TMO_c0723 [Tistrella mobilis KA081020-065]